MYQVVSGYLDHEKYRESFNALAIKTFGLNFESWYQGGHLNKGYVPYGIVKEEKIVANVSINHFRLIIDGVEKKAIQIGTVMTDSDYQNQGMSRYLMAHILKEYDEKEYIVYLFANQDVLEFYPKLGFERVLEQRYEIDAQQIKKAKVNKRLLSCENREDYECIKGLAKNRKPVSQKLGIIQDEWPLLVYCDDADTGELYYIEEDEMIVKATRKDGILHLYDVLSIKDFELDQVLENIIDEEDEKIRVHFVPDQTKYTVVTNSLKNDEDALFIRKGQVFPGDILFPVTSHT